MIVALSPIGDTKNTYLVTFINQTEHTFTMEAENPGGAAQVTPKQQHGYTFTSNLFKFKLHNADKKLPITPVHEPAVTYETQTVTIPAGGIVVAQIDLESLYKLPQDTEITHGEVKIVLTVHNQTTNKHQELSSHWLPFAPHYLPAYQEKILLNLPPIPELNLSLEAIEKTLHPTTDTIPKPPHVEPTPPLPSKQTPEQERLKVQEKIGVWLYHQLHDLNDEKNLEATKAELFCGNVGGKQQAAVRILTPYGEYEEKGERFTMLPPLPEEIKTLLQDLKHAMYRDDEGTWLELMFTVTSTGNFKTTTNYNRMPAWEYYFTTGDYRKELENYPRDLKNIPAWFEKKITQHLAPSR